MLFSESTTIIMALILGAAVVALIAFATLFIRRTNSLFALIQQEFPEAFAWVVPSRSHASDGSFKTVYPAMRMFWQWRLTIVDPRVKRLQQSTVFYVALFGLSFAAAIAALVALLPDTR